ncbi:MAG: DNA-3-methyladenine glycosylase [Actinomycetota bacterium]
MARPLARSFYARPALVVARALLGRELVRTLPDGQVLRARIVEAEAYRQDDPASHSFKGRTPTRVTMFGPPGHLYVYVSYGTHFCMNVVTGRDGEGSAVLLRAAEPMEGLETMAELRRLAEPRLLCAGPGRLCQAVGITRQHDGTDLVQGPDLRVERGRPVADGDVVAGPRVGLTVAMEQPWRFTIRGSRYVSRGPVRLPGTAPGR